MRLLFVSSQYPPYELGGHEQLCYEVVNALLLRGHDVRVLTSCYGVTSPSQIYTNHIHRSLQLMADIHYYKPLDFFFKLPSQEKQNLVELKNNIDQFKPDLIMFWGMFALSPNLPYWAEQWMPGRVTYYIASYWPIDVDLHELYWKTPANHRVTEWIKRPLRRIALTKLQKEDYPPDLKFDHVICCSEYVRERLVSAGKLFTSAEVIYPGSDPEPFLRTKAIGEMKTSGAVRLLYFGRLVHDKGVHTAIEAVGLLKRKGLADQIELTILGEGHPDYKNYLRLRAKELGIEHHVLFVNKVARADIPEIISSFDVFLFTSIWPEPFGRTIVEAMMAGLVVIGTDVGGSREIFRHYDSELLFQPEDAQGLASRITRVISDPDFRHNLMERGRQLASEQFSISQTVSSIEKFLTQVVVRASTGKSL